MPATKDYYEILGVPRDADEKAIKSSYRHLARECHPDVNPGDPQAEERFKDLSEAYSVLSDPEQRAAYDHFGPDFAKWQNGAPTGGPGGARWEYQTTGQYGDIGDLFETLLGGMGRRSSPRHSRQKGRDLQKELEIGFAASVLGGIETLRVELDEPCAACDGQGVHHRACQVCGGSGADQSKRSVLGPAPCRECGGSGQVPTDRCTECRGSGAAHRSRKVEVTVPAGVKTGSKVRVKGEGLAGTGGSPRGDLILDIKVRSHPFFGRKGDDLTCEVPISFAEAVLGGEIMVPTKDGRAALKIPAGTQNGQTFRLRGMGAPRVGGSGSGDQLVTVRIAVPKKASKRVRELAEELRRDLPDDPRAGLGDCRLKQTSG